VPVGTTEDPNQTYYYLNDNGEYIEYSTLDGEHIWRDDVAAGRIFTKSTSGDVIIEAGHEIKGEAPIVSFGGDNIYLTAEENINESAGKEINSLAGEEITIDAPVVNINGSDNLYITSINYLYEQVPSGTAYDPTEDYYQQDENGNYIPYAYDPSTWADDVTAGKIYTKVLGDNVTYGDINILGGDVYVRDPDDTGDIEDRKLGKLHAVADYATSDDSEYYIINSNKRSSDLTVNGNGHYLIPINSLDSEA